MNEQRGKQHARATARREQLLKTALEMFAKRGYRATSVRDIARAVGVNEGLLYHYFANKSDLFTAVLAAYAPFEPCAAILDGSAARPIDGVLRDLGREFLSLVGERRAFVVTILSEGSVNPELGRILGQFVRGTRSRLADFLARRQANGEIDPFVDVEAAAQAFVGGLLFEVLSAILSPEEASQPRSDGDFVEHLVGVLLRGLSPRARDRSVSSPRADPVTENP